jgi:uncharacterized protein YfcZ (UPF0381/DUF406 family)
LWNEWRLQPLREISAPRKSFSAALFQLHRKSCKINPGLKPLRNRADIDASFSAACQAGL